MTRKTIAFKVLGAGPELESWIESCEAPFAPQAEREPATAAVDSRTSGIDRRRSTYPGGASFRL